MKLISIVTIVFNGELFIEETIKSVVSQKTDLVEYIVVDGGSSDSTLEIIKRYENQIDLIVSEIDTGIYNAINKGIDLSNGMFIGLIHSGDKYNVGALQKVINVAKSLNSAVIYGDIVFLENEGELEIKRYLIANHMNLKIKMSIFHPSTFISKDLYLKFGTYQECFKMAADYDLLLNFYLNRVPFHHLSSAISTFRADGMSSKNFILNLKENYLLRLKYFNIFNAIMFVIKSNFFFVLYNIRRNFLIFFLGKSYFNQLKSKIHNK